ncbi:MAG: Fe-S cluster assembly ATPase SufC [Chloroflexi bacterium]|nr:Fe-S cluster assembly ATPase SufC [Chloroflexota bacterium]MDE2702621.1 Fe-S cluster assembly ATPase SufC [Chloroflexota bacterium]MDE2937218.1 Fe-S cluster assembly ATPase SufC [Chloroflexota bacterium]MXX66166.1 Fe-S cluster assembly ATPase SufC [Chloroflexota bacterium]MXX99739.1 Fe-S cluster assembly ATPase SufC [Chloroflexota bacterium]
MTPNPLLQIEDLHVQRDDKEILHGLNLTVDEGQVHAVMGPNGSGKSTLANTLMGNPSCEITAGRILFRGEDISEWEVDERARAGIFLAFQYPVEIPGVPLVTFLREAINAVRGDEGPIGVREFRLRMLEKMDLLSVDSSFASRYLNDGFSGGEKKRCEILQMAMLEPALGILDETDSGLDIDALRIVAEGVNSLRTTDIGVLLITHYQRILRYIQPDFVHVLIEGDIVADGGPELAEALERDGYKQFAPETV